MENIEKRTPQLEVKESWAKPELEMVSVKENTLASAGPLQDGPVFS